MSLERLFVEDWQDWDEVDTGVIMLVNPSLTPRFKDFVANLGFELYDNATLTLIHGFNRENPVVLQQIFDNGNSVEMKMDIESFAIFVLKAS